MRILLIPIEKPEPRVRTGDWHAAIYHLLSQKHEVIGVVRPRWHSIAGKRFKGKLILIYYWFKSFIFGLVHIKEYDLIYCMNTPHTLVGFLLSFLANKPFIWDAPNPSLFNPGFLSRPLFMMEKMVSRKASGIKMVSKEYKDRYVEEGFDKNKMVIIPHLANLDSIDEVYAEKEELRRKLGLGIEEKILIFIGQGSTPFNMKAIEWLNDELALNIEGRILVTGTTSIPKGYQNLIFAGYVPNVYEYIYAADAAVVPIWKSSGAPVPSTRTIELMSCSKPVVVTDFLLEAIPQLIDGKNTYIAKTEEDFKQKVVHILRNPEEASRVGRDARDLVEKEYSWAAGSRKLEELLEV